MTERQLRWLLATYPRAWRARYREEIEVLAEDLWSSGETTHARLVVDLLLGGVAARGRWMRTWFRRSLALPLGAAVMVGVALVALTTSGPAPLRARSDVVLTTGGLRSFGATFGLRTFPARVALKSGTGVAGFVQRAAVLGSETSGLSGSGPGPGFGVPVFSASRDIPVGKVVPAAGYSGSAAPTVGAGCGDAATHAATGSSSCAGASRSVPEVVGVATPTASARISSLGLAVDVENGDCAAGQSGLVGRMSPAPGTTLPRGRVVTIENCL